MRLDQFQDTVEGEFRRDSINADESIWLNECVLLIITQEVWCIQDCTPEKIASLIHLKKVLGFSGERHRHSFVGM